MRLLITASFLKAAKKLHAPHKAKLDLVLKSISQDPWIGETKAGDLMGIRVYKFRLSNEVCLLAYRILDEDSIKLLTFGPHENFYRDLKRHDH